MVAEGRVISIARRMKKSRSHRKTSRKRSHDTVVKPVDIPPISCSSLFLLLEYLSRSESPWHGEASFSCLALAVSSRRQIRRIFVVRSLHFSLITSLNLADVGQRPTMRPLTAEVSVVLLCPRWTQRRSVRALKILRLGYWSTELRDAEVSSSLPTLSRSSWQRKINRRC